VCYKEDFVSSVARDHDVQFESARATENLDNEFSILFLHAESPQSATALIGPNQLKMIGFKG
jgi:hypothetical protein